MKNKVFFVGAGPGDPELLTIKGKRIIDNSDIVVYAGSLVNPKVLSDVKNKTQIYNSASMNLEEVMEVMITGVKNNKSVVRVHTGDPSIYGAIKEQIDWLEKEGIDCVVIPGVSSFTASASVLKREFTLPNISQTVICTRMGGRTSVPEDERLDKLAAHKASMAIFLSIQMIEKVVEKLITHYPINTPVAVVQRATWPDQKIVLGTLETIKEKVKAENITKTAQILVGDFLGEKYELSKLYDKNFSHEFRERKR